MKCSLGVGCEDAGVCYASAMGDSSKCGKMTDTRDSFVNVKPVIVADAPDAHQVWLDIGVQHFTIGEYCETKDEAEWLAAQLRIALTALQAGAGDGVVSAILDLQPLGESRNDATRIWQMYVTPEAAMEAVKQAIDNAQATEGK